MGEGSCLFQIVQKICWKLFFVLLFSGLVFSSTSLCIVFSHLGLAFICNILAMIVWMTALVIIPIGYKTKISVILIAIGLVGIFIFVKCIGNAFRFSINYSLGFICWFPILCFCILLIILGWLIRPKVWKIATLVGIIAIASGIIIILLGVVLFSDMFIRYNPTFIALLWIIGFINILLGFLIEKFYAKETVQHLIIVALIVVTTFLTWASIIYTWQYGFMT